jgi:putative NIF3 family GTP cyclohydrolase 1 type 2
MFSYSRANLEVFTERPIFQETHIKLAIGYYYHIITALLRGGRTQIAKHNFDVFEGGGLVNVSKHLFSNYVLFAKFHFSRSPHS